MPVGAGLKPAPTSRLVAAINFLLPLICGSPAGQGAPARITNLPYKSGPKTRVKLKEAGDPRSSSPQGMNHRRPGFPGPRNDSPPERSPGPCPESSVDRPRCFGGGAGIYRRVRQSAPGRPSKTPWIAGRLLAQGPKQVAEPSSPEADPTLPGCGLRPPSRHLVGAQAELPSIPILSMFFEKARARQTFSAKNRRRGMGPPLLSPGLC